MDGNWDLFEVWSYDEYLHTFQTRERAMKYIDGLVEDGIYMRRDLTIRQVSG